MGDRDERLGPLLRLAIRSPRAATDATMGEESREHGASMVEYALLLVLILLAAFFTVQVFGDSIVALFETMGKALDNAPNVGSDG